MIVHVLAAPTYILITVYSKLNNNDTFFCRFMYVCAATVCVYLGVFIVASTVFYTVWAFDLRRRLQASYRGHGSR